MTSSAPAISDLRDVSLTYPRPSGDPLQVLSHINLELREGEIVGLLGRSGAGKSTLLRIAAGLIRPSAGEALYRGRVLEGPTEGIAVVFQTFALFPWLNVFENVEAGLDALGLSDAEARERTLAAIDLIGLTGFHSAYPRELSGGMRQRVGFARALVTRPDLLLMDEPFSALDVLTAQTLCGDFIDLWNERQLPTRSVLMVTHNIEEAVQMCDRVAVLAANPGRIAAEIPISLPHPRDRLDSAFREIVDEIYEILTARSLDPQSGGKETHVAGTQPLPPAPIGRIHAVIAHLATTGTQTADGQAAGGQAAGGQAAGGQGRADLADVARALGLNADQLLPVAEALTLLNFAELGDGALRLTAAGNAMANGDAGAQQRLFREHLLRFVPIAAHIHHVLGERTGHVAPRLRFEAELEDHLVKPDANRTLQTVIAWGRYAQLFDYDDRARQFRAWPEETVPVPAASRS